MYPLSTFLKQPVALGLAIGFFAGSAVAQTIPNSSFESDTFTAFPGYAAGNGGAITGWTSTKLASVGLNPGGGSPFANNGTIPNGVNAAFLQSTVGGTDLSTTISGLTAGTAYRVSFRANARAGNVPILKATVDAVAVNLSADFAASAASVAVTSVNSANPYHYISFEFTAAAPTAALTLLNDAAGDNTVVVDDFSVTLATDTLAPGIVASLWTGDADCRVDSQYRYTHARTFGGGAVAATVNGVIFAPSPGGNPSAGDYFSSVGLGNNFGDQGRNVSGGSNLIAKSFAFGGGAEARGITIGGLKPNTTYVASVYGIGWENGQRSADFSGTAGGITSNINLDAYGAGNGIVVQYRYTTDGSGTAVTLNYSLAAGSGTYHTAGFSNREALPGSTASTWTVAPWTDNATSGVNDGASYHYTHAYKFGVATNAVINGVTFTGIAGGNPSAANFSTAGFGSLYTNDINNVVDAGGSRTLANDFVYNGFPGVVRLTGLTPGTEYLFTFYSVGWDPSGRTALFAGYEQTGAIYDQDNYGDNAGVRVSYTYTAPASGSIMLTTSPTAGGSIHLYGISNRKTTPETNLAFTTQPTDVFVNAVGDTATFTASASGNLPLTYQWKKNGDDIPGQSGTTNLSTSLVLTGVTAADVANYTVSFTGSGGQGTIVSTAGHLYLITDKVPGLFDTGMGDNCTVLADGLPDPHYLILANPDGDSLIPAVVEDSANFPIVAGPWIANTATSKWVGPRFQTQGAAGAASDGGAGFGIYSYATTFDLTGFDLNSVRISGTWATDNLGVKMVINGIDLGLTNTSQFVTQTPFLITGASNFVAGVNTLEFFVQNQDAVAGYTGLRVDGLVGFGSVLPNSPPHIATQPVNTTIPRNGMSCLSVSASGTAPLTYQWFKDGLPISGGTSSTLMITADSGAKAGNYTVTVSGVAPAATSTVAVVTIPNEVPTFAGYSFSTKMNVPANVAAQKMLAKGADADLDSLSLSAVSPASAMGGTVSLASGVVTYTPASAYVGMDTFTVTLADGWGGEVVGTVTVNVTNGTGLSQNQAMIQMLPGGNMAMLFMGIPGQSYEIQRSTDLATWMTLTTLVATADGQLPYTDTAPPVGAAFYRTKTP